MKTNYLLFKLLLLIQLMAFFVIESKAQDKPGLLGHRCVYTNISNKDHKGKCDRLLRHLIHDENGLPAVHQKIVISPEKLFAIHYDTTGNNAPSPIDLNHNGIPDYVDSVCYYFERAYHIQVETMGYKSPIPDNGGRGTPQYDVYLWDLGNSDSDTNDTEYDNGGGYGYTFSLESDNIIGTQTYSYIIIDNNFSPTDSVRPLIITENNKIRKAFSETGINALKITASHEFQHAIQLMYGATSTTIMEMCAVAMEFRLYPETKDYFQYVANIFHNSSAYPFGIEDNQSGYGYSIFARYLIQNYGDKPLKRLWEIIGSKNGSKNNAYRALDSSITELGSSFPIEWQNFLNWCYFTGKRSISGKYFADAKILPEMTFFKDSSFYSPPSISNFGNLRPLEIRALRFNFKGIGNNSDDTLDIMLGNIDINSAIAGVEPITTYEVQATGEQVTGSEKLDGINYFYKDTYNKQKIALNKYIRPGSFTSGIDFCYPNPYYPNDGNTMVFPAPENSELYDETILTVFTSDMVPLYSERLKVMPDNKHRVVFWDKVPTDISSGVYIFRTSNKDNIKLGKFSVIRK